MHHIEADYGLAFTFLNYKPESLFTEINYKCKLHMLTYVYNIYVTFVIKYFDMKERLIQLLDLEQLSPSKFADIIGVQRSSISHVLSGRNKPSFDFLQKTLKAFPGLNASWLMLGEGTMYEQMGRKVSGNLFDSRETDEVPVQEDILESAGPDMQISSSEAPVQASAEQETVPEGIENLGDNEIKSRGESEKKATATETKRIVQVMVIYEDDTFRTFMPAH